jgi:hypothetical protein
MSTSHRRQPTLQTGLFLLKLLDLTKQTLALSKNLRGLRLGLHKAIEPSKIG